MDSPHRRSEQNKSNTRSAMDAPYTRMRWIPCTHESQCEIGDGFPLRIAHVRRDTPWYCDTQCYIFSTVKLTMDALDTRSEKLPLQNRRWMSPTRESQCKIGNGFPLHIAHVSKNKRTWCSSRAQKQWLNMSKRHCRDGGGEAPFPLCRARGRPAMGRYRVRNAQN